jgi:DNA replication licensing factor MCM6
MVDAGMTGDIAHQLGQVTQRHFIEFLKKFRTGDAEDQLYYVAQAKHMVIEKRKTLYVQMDHLKNLNEADVSFRPQDLQQVIEEKYFSVREYLNQSVLQFLRAIQDDEGISSQFTEDEKAGFKRLIEDQTFREEKNLQYFSVAFFNLEYLNSIRTLKTHTLGKLVSISGTVTRTTEVKPELLEGTFMCLDCSRIISNVVQQFKVTMPTICTNPACGNRKNFKLSPNARTTRWGDWQRIRLQENENEVPAGSMPRTLDVIVRDEQVDRCKPGDKIRITGCLIVVPEVPSLMNPSELKQSVRRELNARYNSSLGGREGIRGLSALGSRDLTYKLSFFGGFVEPDEHWSRSGNDTDTPMVNIRADEGKQLFLSQEQQERLVQISEHVGQTAKRDCFDILAHAICPAIEGHLQVKKGILLMLIGGLRKTTTDEGMKLRGDVNCLLVGDPATGKSQFLKWVASFLPRAVYTSGKSSSAAGLTASVTREQDMPGQEKVIEPGALMLADNGICCIDEFELMDEKDRVAIHEAMEQQTITLSKAGMQATLNARTAILAAALPRNHRYKDTLPFEKNVDLSPPIMSRFDLKFVLRDVANPVDDASVAAHIAKLHSGVDMTVPERITQLELQQYIALARQQKPKITPGARVRLGKRYKQMRQEQGRGVTVRQLESLLRLSEAVARVHLSDYVTPEFVDTAFSLVNSTRTKMADREIGLDEDVGLPASEEAEADAEAAEKDGADAGAQGERKRKLKLTFSEYQRIGKMLAQYLETKQRDNEPVTEAELTYWYLEQIEGDLKSEAMVIEQQHLIQLVINRLIEKDRVIIIYKESDDAARPENRVLIKHPNFNVAASSVTDPRGVDSRT